MLCVNYKSMTTLNAADFLDRYLASWHTLFNPGWMFYKPIGRPVWYLAQAGIPLYKFEHKIASESPVQHGEIQLFETGAEYGELDHVHFDDMYDALRSEGWFVFITHNMHRFSGTSDEDEEIGEKLLMALRAIPDEQTWRQFKVQLFKTILEQYTIRANMVVTYAEIFSNQDGDGSLLGSLLKKYRTGEITPFVTKSTWPDLCYYSEFPLDEAHKKGLEFPGQLTLTPTLHDLSMVGHLTGQGLGADGIHVVSISSRDRCFAANDVRTAQLDIAKIMVSNTTNYHLAVKPYAHWHVHSEETQFVMLSAMKQLSRERSPMSADQILPSIVGLDYKKTIAIHDGDELDASVSWKKKVLKRFNPWTRKTFNETWATRDEFPHWQHTDNAITMLDIPFFSVTKIDNPPLTAPYPRGEYDFLQSGKTVVIDAIDEASYAPLIVPASTRAKLETARRGRGRVTFSWREKYLIELQDTLRTVCPPGTPVEECKFRREVLIAGAKFFDSFVDTGSSMAMILVPWRYGRRYTPWDVLREEGFNVICRKPWYQLCFLDLIKQRLGPDSFKNLNMELSFWRIPEEPPQNAPSGGGGGGEDRMEEDSPSDEEVTPYDEMFSVYDYNADRYGVITRFINSDSLLFAYTPRPGDGLTTVKDAATMEMRLRMMRDPMRKPNPNDTFPPLDACFVLVNSAPYDFSPLQIPEGGSYRLHDMLKEASKRAESELRSRETVFRMAGGRYNLSSERPVLAV